MTYTKLFSSITESTIWVEPYPTRIVWVSMLAMADRKGRIWASVPGLARRAGVTLEECETALKRFQEPDKYSRTPDNEGRRIESIDGGWALLNYEKYRSARDEESRREYQREWDRTRRKPTASDTNPTQPDTEHRKASDKSESDTSRPPPTKAEAEAEAEKTYHEERASGAISTAPAHPPPRAPSTFKAPEERVHALAAICHASRMQVSRDAPRVRQWAADGLTDDQLREAIRRARNKAPEPLPLRINFLACFVDEVRAEPPRGADAVKAVMASIAAKEASNATH